MYDVIWAAKLVELYDAGDPLADDVIAAIANTQGLPAVQKVMGTWVREKGIRLDDTMPEVQKFRRESKQLPDWIDNQKMELAANFFADHSLEIVMMLFLASLPTLYAAKQGAEVLMVTKHMVNYTYLERRIFETAQFVLNVTDEGAFGENGKGFEGTQKTRLVHAAVRYLIANDPRWSKFWESIGGIPISQVELAGTMLSFSVTVIQGLEKCGLRISEAEKEAYSHLWTVIGHLMGIRQELLPKDYKDAEAFMATCKLRFTESSPTGRILTDVLLQFLDRHSDVPNALISDSIRHAVGRYTADALGLDGSRYWTWIFLFFQKIIWSVESLLEHHIPLISQLSRFIDRRVIGALLDYEREIIAKEDIPPENLRSKKLEVPSHMAQKVKRTRSSGRNKRRKGK